MNCADSSFGTGIHDKTTEQRGVVHAEIKLGDLFLFCDLSALD
jgi:hypothetical protein